jgi:2-aminoadipate transaminase
MNFESLLAERTGKMGTNVIREILKVVSQPGMVSLAGGIPAPESFPMEIINKFFYTRKGEGIETMRLNYTMTDEDTIDKAVKVLSEVIKQELNS